MHAITLMLTHQMEKAKARVQDAERCLQEEMPAEQRQTLMSLIAAFHGNLARLFGDHERCIPFAQQALELMPEMEVMSLTRMFRPSTLVTAASAYLVDGNLTAATERQVEAALASVRALGNLPTTLRSISNLARLQLLQGKLHQAAATIEQVRQMAPKQGGLQKVLNGADYYFILGELLREWNQLNSAEQHLVQGIDLVRETMAADAEMITRGNLSLARLQQERGEGVRALETLDAFVLMGRQRGFAPVLLAHAAAVRVQLQLAQGNLAAATHWAEMSGLSVNDELRYLHEPEYLTLARVRIAQGRVDPRGPFFHDALDLLDRLLQDAETKARMSSVLEILILRALTLDALNDPRGALSTLERALLLAEAEGYIRIFIDEGVAMLTLLRKAHAHTIASAYVATLLEASGEPTIVDRSRSSLGSDSLVEPLSERELEILQMLIEGASNREIAGQLVLSVNTVKKHVFNICGKLNVQSRTQAIAKVRTLNLL
jgi:LuxR family maltose regulon positive regulatory protein